MLAKVGHEKARDAATELDRHFKMLGRFVECAGQAAPEHRSLTLILRSADSEPAQAMSAMSGDLARAGIRPKVILAKLESGDALRRLVSAMEEIYGREALPEQVRWARNPRLKDAHEQAIFGHCGCWTGDAMGRDPSRRNALSLFAEDAPEMVQLAELSFVALWRASEPVSAGRLFGAPAVRHDVFDPSDDAIDLGLVRPTVHIWPQVRN